MYDLSLVQLWLFIFFVLFFYSFFLGCRVCSARISWFFFLDKGFGSRCWCTASRRIIRRSQMRPCMWMPSQGVCVSVRSWHRGTVAPRRLLSYLLAAPPACKKKQSGERVVDRAQQMADWYVHTPYAIHHTLYDIRFTSEYLHVVHTHRTYTRKTVAAAMQESKSVWCCVTKQWTFSPSAKYYRHCGCRSQSLLFQTNLLYSGTALINRAALF